LSLPFSPGRLNCSGPECRTRDPGTWVDRHGDVLVRYAMFRLGGTRLAYAFTLRDIDGRESKEICKVLGVSETTLWVILHRARMLMRRCLEIHWFGGDAGKR
jgi:hypothetical protein